RGSTFWFTALLRADADPPRPAAMTEPEPELEPELIVPDPVLAPEPEPERELEPEMEPELQSEPEPEPEPESEPEPEPEFEPALRHGSLLLAEDDPVNRRVTMAMLQRSGYRVEVATDGLEAVRAVAARSFDAVLMDCRMPRMDGVQATIQIRAAEGRRRRTPIIALSASTSAEDREIAIAAGMDDYLAKPVTSDELLTTVDRWIFASAGNPVDTR
ncbi:MAG TPA: response regulator, partial [Acidimicrobiales bacterium]|nr:response regulator [Acidimicrobiales bacterium]